MANELTYKQRLFVEAYLGETKGNATEAARIAGFAHPHVQCVRLLANARIRAKIEQRVASAAMPANEVLARLSEIATTDMADFLKFDKDKSTFMIDIKGAKKRRRSHLIKKITPTKYGLKIELHDPLTALDKLARYHNLFQGDEGTSLADRLETAYEVIKKRTGKRDDVSESGDD